MPYNDAVRWSQEDNVSLSVDRSSDERGLSAPEELQSRASSERTVSTTRHRSSAAGETGEASVRRMRVADLSFAEQKCRGRICRLMHVLDLETVGQLLEWAARQPRSLRQITDYSNVGPRTVEVLVDALKQAGIDDFSCQSREKGRRPGREWTPHRIKHMRRTLGWSVRDLADFFDRTKAAVYYWENGESQPGKNIELLLTSLEKECEYHRSVRSPRGFLEWSRQVAAQGVLGFLKKLSRRPTIEENIYQDLARQAEAEGNILLAPADGPPVACIVPLNKAGLDAFARSWVAGDAVLAESV